MEECIGKLVGYLVSSVLKAVRAEEKIKWLVWNVSAAVEYFMRNPLFENGFNWTRLKRTLTGLKMRCSRCGCRGHADRICPSMQYPWWSQYVEQCSGAAHERIGESAEGVIGEQIDNHFSGRIENVEQNITNFCGEGLDLFKAQF
jgi:hypothetical protein